MVFEQIKLTLKSGSVLKNQHQAVVTLDFDKTQRHQALMRLCFSPLAAWPLLLALLVFMINPLRYHLSLSQILGVENIVVQLLFGMDWLFAGFISLAFFLITYFFKLELALLAFTGYLLSQGDMHLFLGIVLLACILLARILTNLRWVGFLESYTKSVWLVTSCLSFAAWALSAYFSFELYKMLLQGGYFTQSMYTNRLETFILIVCIYYGLELIILSVWGHFYVQKKSEPSEFLVQYSTSRILKKLHLGKAFKAKLKEKVIELQKGKRAFGSSDLDLLPKRLVELHKKEESFLTQAVSDLT